MLQDFLLLLQKCFQPELVPSGSDSDSLSLTDLLSLPVKLRLGAHFLRRLISPIASCCFSFQATVRRSAVPELSAFSCCRRCRKQAKAGQVGTMQPPPRRPPLHLYLLLTAGAAAQHGAHINIVSGKSNKFRLRSQRTLAAHSWNSNL